MKDKVESAQADKMGETPVAEQKPHDGDGIGIVVIAALFIAAFSYRYLGIVGVVLVAIPLVNGVIGGSIANLRRKGAFWLGFWMSLLVPVIGWIIACILPKEERPSNAQTATEAKSRV